MENKIRPKLIIIGLTLAVCLIVGVLFFNRHLGRSRAANEKVALSADKTNLTLKAGESETIHIQILPKTAGAKISGFDLIFTAAGATIGVGQPQGINGGSVNFIQIAATDERVVYIIKGDDGSLPLGVDLPVTITAASNGAGSVGFMATSTVVGNISQYFYEIDPADTITVNGSPTTTPTGDLPVTPLPTPLPEGNANLNIKLKFQGIGAAPADHLNSMAVRIGVVREGEETPDFEDMPPVTFTAGDKGIWSGTLPYDLTDTGAKYKIYVKGPNHLQKKICDARPAETSPGTYRCSIGKIVLATGENDLDLSEIIQLSGDLPSQNGVIDAGDITLVRENFSQVEPKADINLDGVVDTQDYSLIISSMGVKYDEE